MTIRIDRTGKQWAEWAADSRGHRQVDHMVRLGKRPAGFITKTPAGFFRAYHFDSYMGHGPLFSLQAAARYAAFGRLPRGYDHREALAKFRAANNGSKR